MRDTPSTKGTTMPAFLEPIAAIACILAVAVVFNLIAYRFTK